MSFPDGLDPGAGICAPPTWSGLVPKISAIGKKTPIVTKVLVVVGRMGRRREESGATTIYSVATTLLILLKNPQWNREQ